MCIRDRYNTEKNLKYGYATPAFYTLNSKGLLAGTNFSTASAFLNASVVNTGINRYDMAQLMTNIMKAKGFAASASQKTAIQSKITDYKNIPSQYQDAVKNVYALGIISGYADGRFVGTNIMNRGQAAIVIQRMAQYAPVTGDKDNDQFDDGTSQKPTPTPTPDPKPVEPTPTPTPKPEETNPNKNTLVDGSPITEANVMRLMEARVAEWGKKTWGSYSMGNSGDVRRVVSTYRASGSSALVSCQAGCGGWATYLCDAAFGSTGFPMRKVTNINSIRPGDILIWLTDGRINHISIVSGKTNVRDFGTYTKTYYGVYEANANTIPGHSPNGIDPTSSTASTNYDSNTGYLSLIHI